MSKVKCRVSGCPSNCANSVPMTFHHFPKHRVTLNAWIKILGVSPTRENLNSLQVCARHFDDEDLVVQRHGKTIKPRNMAVPKRNLPDELSKKIPSVEQEMFQELFSLDSGESDGTDPAEDSGMEIAVEEKPETDDLRCSSESSDRFVKKKLLVDGSTQTDSAPKFQAIITFERLDARQMLYFTEFSHEQFNALFSFLVKSKSLSLEILNKFSFMSPADQLLLTLYKYRINQDFSMTGALFNLTPHLTCQIFKHWTEIINLSLKDIDFWSLGKTDGSKFRVCLHCVKVFLDSDQPPGCRIEAIKKKCFTAKFRCLIGINEGGIVIFCSKLFKYDVSFRQIFVSANILDGLEKGDTILTNHDFTIDDLLQEKGVALKVSPFLLDRDSAQMSDIGPTQSLTGRKIHVDRLATLVKTYRILSDPIENDLLPLLSDIMYNCAMLCNFKPKKK